MMCSDYSYHSLYERLRIKFNLKPITFQKRTATN
nr:MAG TPA: hypothetical protein [Caudoviricetes sp.]